MKGESHMIMLHENGKAWTFLFFSIVLAWAARQVILSSAPHDDDHLLQRLHPSFRVFFIRAASISFPAKRERKSGNLRKFSDSESRKNNLPPIFFISLPPGLISYIQLLFLRNASITTRWKKTAKNKGERYQHGRALNIFFLRSTWCIRHLHYTSWTYLSFHRSHSWWWKAGPRSYHWRRK